MAKSTWMRMAADRSLGAYQAYKAADDLPEPEWPDKPFNELMRIAFANGYLINQPGSPGDQAPARQGVIDFREIWAADFEFIADPGGRPIPVCLVARELRTGRLVRQWRSEFG